MKKPQYIRIECNLLADNDTNNSILTRAWLMAHGWETANNYPLFQGDGETFDADLCVVVNSKDYMVARFHYMGLDAFKASAKPSSFDVVGVNNSIELKDYDYTRLVMAAFVCHLAGFEDINKAIGGGCEIMATNRPLTECDDSIKYKNGECIGDNSAAKGNGLCKKLNENGEYINPEKELRNSIEDFKEVCLYPIANYGNSIITRIIKKICKLTHHKSDDKIKKLEE